MCTAWRRLTHWLANLTYRQIVLLGLGLGVILSIALFFSVLRQEYAYDTANFHLEARAAAVAVQQSLEYGAHDFAAARSLFIASSEVTRDEFNLFVGDQYATNPLPGLLALEWVPYVPAAQRTLFEQTAQAEGLPDFHFTERDEAGRLAPAGMREEYYPVYYVAPLDGFDHVLGFDLGSDATRLGTMQQARDSGEPALTGPVVLVQSPGGARASLIFLPIFDNDAAVATVADRRAHLRGFLLGVFDLHTVLTAGQNPQSATTLDLYLLDESLPPAEQLLFYSPAHTPALPGTATSTRVPVAGLAQLRDGLHYERPIQIGDRTWQLLITPAPTEGEGEILPLPLITMLAVLAFSTLATAYIARRRQVRDLLQQSEEKYRMVVENVSEVIWAADAATLQINFVTPSAQKLSGYTLEEVRQLRLDQIIAPESVWLLEAYMASRIAARAAGDTRTYVDVVALLRRDGVKVWTETTTHLATDPQTQKVQLFGITRDITERRRTERTQAGQFAVNRILAQSPQLQEGIVQVLEALTVGLGWLGAEFWQRTADGDHLVWCAGWSRPDHPKVAQFLRQSTDYTFARGEGLIGRTWQDNQAYWENDLDSHLDYPRHKIGIAAGMKAAIAIPVCINDEILGVIVFHDATAQPQDAWLLEALVDLGRQIGQFIARKEAEIDLHNERALLAQRVQERTADLRMANAELAHALNAKDEFLANMSHELRTPLNGILTLAESLHEGTYGPLNSHQQRSMTLISQSGEHLLALINDILDLAKVAAGKLDMQVKSVSAFAVSQASLALVQEMASRKSIQLAFHCNDREVELRADVRRLKQVLVNLLGNAIKFTPAGGHVNLIVTATPAAREIEFVVQDDGIGIPPAEQSKLFKPFTQLDASLARPYEGTGLGLALVWSLVELHGGWVRVESTGISGQGSRFIVTLPWEDAVPYAIDPQDGFAAHPPDGTGADANLPARSSSADGAAPAPAPAYRARVLIVDDNELNLLALEDYLENAGFQLSFATDGEEALQQAEAVRPDLILMDIQMPKMTGIEATRRLRADPRFAATPILALTALAMPGDRELCLEAGANAYISKPFSLKELVKTITSWLEAARPAGA